MASMERVSGMSVGERLGEGGLRGSDLGDVSREQRVRVHLGKPDAFGGVFGRDASCVSF